MLGNLLASERPRVIIFGSRNFQDRKFLYKTMDRLTAKLKNPIIVVGVGYLYVSHAFRYMGADYFGEQWAYERYFTVMKFAPDKERYKLPAALHIRNREMVSYCIERRPAYGAAFWDGETTGTASTIELCKKAKINLEIFNF